MSDLFQKKINVTSSNAVYLPGLNGLRAIAALAVVVSHITLSLDQFGLNSNVFGTDINGSPKGLDLAGDGVTIFFALSGFLITFLFLKEKENGSISIKKFYVRRILRIWPLYYLFFFIPINRFHIASVADQDLIAIISVVLITGQVTRKNYIINLENKACDFIGKISYGMYVIHPLLIFFMKKYLENF